MLRKPPRDRDPGDPAPPPPLAAASAPRRRRLARRLPRAPRRVPLPTPRTAVPSPRRRFRVFATFSRDVAETGSCVRSNRTGALRRRALRKKKLSSRRAPAATSRFRRGSPRTATRPRSRRAAGSTGARRSRVPCADRASEMVSERPRKELERTRKKTPTRATRSIAPRVSVSVRARRPTLGRTRRFPAPTAFAIPFALVPPPRHGFFQKKSR